MKSPLRRSNRLSNFRFSLTSLGPLRSPVSPLTPPLPFHLQHQQPPPNYHANSSTRTSTAPTLVGPDAPNDKIPSVAVTAFETSSTDDHIINKTLEVPSALPTPVHSRFTTTHINSHYYHQPTHSPITPWHATFHRNAASTDQETHYLNQTTHLRRARITITLLLFLLSATITALSSSILHAHLTTRLPTSFSLPLWPTDLNLTPTTLTLTTSTLTLLLTLPTTTLHLLRGPNPRTPLCNTLFTILSLSTTLLTLTTLTTSTLQSSHPLFSTFISTLTSLVQTTGPQSTQGLTPNGSGPSPHPETIQSFTCALSNTASQFTRDARTLALPYPADTSNMVPSGFSRICLQSQVDVSLVIVLCVVGAVGVVIGLWSWSVERGIEGLRGEREVLASREGKFASEGEVNGRVMKMPAYVEKRDLEGRC